MASLRKPRTATQAPAERTIPYQFSPRQYQREVFSAFDNGIKRAVLVWHRRSGKDKSLFNLTVREACKRVGSYFYLFPFYSQGKKILWNGMDRDGFPFLGHIPAPLLASKNEADLKLTLKNGSIIQIVGTDRIDSIVGTNPVGCVFSEYSLQDPLAWDFIRPILRENDGWAAFCYTPRGHNHAYDLYSMAQTTPGWFCQLLTIDDTGIVSKEAIEQERKEGMREELIRQEYYCSFEAGIVGAIYGKEMERARTDGRICGVPIKTGVPVDTYWDLGYDDSTTIWFVQNVGREIHLVDYYENFTAPLQHYVDILKQKKKDHGFIYGRHVLPHDGDTHELTQGKTRRQSLFEMGVTCQITKRPKRKEDTIEQVRQIFSICWFDAERCKRGIESLANYHREYDEKLKTYSYSPVHDWASHGADAFQTMAISHRFGPQPQHDYEQPRDGRRETLSWMAM